MFRDIEQERLDSIAKNNKYLKLELNKEMQEYLVKLVKNKIDNLKLLENFTFLEIGPSLGIMTEKLQNITQNYFICEGSSYFAKKLEEKYPNITVYNCLIEELHEEKKYDLILLGHVLEHVDNPIEVLKQIKKLLKEDGKLITIVPNSNSLHRQAAVIMGILNDQKELNETDIFHGHRRVYDLEMLKNDFRESNYEIEEFGGYWLKPLSNKQLSEQWTPEMLEAYFKLGEKYPEISAEIYIIAKRKGE